MREIKFRAWKESERRMIDWVELSNLTDPSLHDVLSGIFLASVMRYTGLKDKNGVEIYEGDIIRFGALALNDSVKYGPMSWDKLPEGVDENDISTELGIKFVGSDIDDWASVKRLAKDNPDVIGVEVIGNIHQNPELLT